MSDKELIKQEIERRYNCEKCYPLDREANVAAAVLQELLLFIDSLPEESASEDKSEKELAETYLAVFDKKHPILPTLKGKQKADFKNFLNKCQQEFGLKEFGIHPTQSKLFEKLTLLWATWGAEHLEGLGKSNQDELDKEPASEDLDFLVISLEETIGTSPHSREVIKEYLQKAAEWQKEQMEDALQTEYEKGRFDMREEMMKDAVESIVEDWCGDSPEITIPLNPQDFKTGDKVKIIIVKED